MSPSPATGTAARDGADRCPGLLTPFVSADGAIVRLRIPGGHVTTATLDEISSLATRYGHPDLTLTSRGSLQVRGLPDPLPDALLTGLLATGTIPSGPHDRVRNIVADPGDPGLRPVVARLDAALLADPDLARLPGRTLLAVARPGGPALAEPADLALVVQPDGQVSVLVDGRAVTGTLEEAVRVAVTTLHRFLDSRGDERTWNVADLDADERAALVPGSLPLALTPAAPPPPGRLGDAALVALVPLGLLTPAQVDALARVADEVQVTPWRSVVVPVTDDAAHVDRVLTDAGLVLDPASPWTVLSACTGDPG